MQPSKSVMTAAGVQNYSTAVTSFRLLKITISPVRESERGIHICYTSHAHYIDITMLEAVITGVRDDRWIISFMASGENSD